jgi:aspartate carbamoyltransferase
VNFSGKPSEAQLAPFVGKDVLDIAQFSKEDLEVVMHLAAHYEEALTNKKRLYDMDGKIMASLFFEPSTRTRLSFEAAMQRLGGNVITVAEAAGAQSSSTAKGETLHDSIKVINDYVDVIVCRSPIKGARLEVANAADIPVINGGDGAGQHPTQALLDMYTIFKEKGSPDGLTVALIGDLKNGRTVHSLADALSLYDVKMIFASPEELTMPEEIITSLRGKNIEVEEVHDLDTACRRADVLYMTRIQRERFTDPAEYERVKDLFIMTGRHVRIFKPGVIVLHPLPRVNEIEVEVDAYPGAAYFRQAANGLPVRMALLAMITGNVK